MRRIMHIDLDAFFVSVEQVYNPDLKGKPVVVGGRPDRRGVVAAASYEARAFGLHSAMPLSTAYRLCPQAIFIEGDFSRYREASKKFMAILADFSPYIEPGGLEEAYLDVTGFESIHGSIPKMAEKIRQRIAGELSLCGSVGIANGKVVAKVASELSKPNGLLEVPAETERYFLAPLPVRRLPGIGEKTEIVLENMGISTIGQLAALPVSEMKERFGVYGVVLHHHAIGIDNSKVEASGEAKSMSRETTFNKDTRNSAFLAATLRYLGEKVGSDLRSQGKQAKCVSLKLRFADFSTITRQQTLNRAIETDLAIFEAGYGLLEKEMRVSRQPVRLIGIGLTNFAAGKQLDLMDASGIRIEKLNSAIDRIREKYGFSAIQTGRTLLLKSIFDRDENE
jgi:DNA polymerase IV